MIRKRLVDVAAAAVGLSATAPLLGPVLVAVYRQDGESPFYIAPRIGRDGKAFQMIKVRSMSRGADKSGVNTTGANDMRITPVGHFVRRYKIDELPQLVNVLKGEMSLVGPRPQVQDGVDEYTDIERGLLDVRPGITDFSSIVFADEGDIVADADDADLEYNRLIRPWKSRLGLFYAANRSVRTDLKLIALTVLSSLDRQKALDGVADLLEELGAEPDLVRVARRQDPLVPHAPPGAEHPVGDEPEA